LKKGHRKSIGIGIVRAKLYQSIYKVPYLPTAVALEVVSNEVCPMSVWQHKHFKLQIDSTDYCNSILCK